MNWIENIKGGNENIKVYLFYKVRFRVIKMLFDLWYNLEVSVVIREKIKRMIKSREVGLGRCFSNEEYFLIL